MSKASPVPLGIVPRSMFMVDGVCSSECIQVYTRGGYGRCIMVNGFVLAVFFTLFSFLGYFGVRVDGSFQDSQQGFHALFGFFFFMCLRQSCVAD